MTTHIGALPEGTRGFDCNTTVSELAAGKFYRAGFRFAVRYVRRRQANVYDVTLTELVHLLEAGLGVMLVQHFAGEDWMPISSLGIEYGANAVDHAKAVGYPQGAVLWCDLESVKKGWDPENIIAYCNRWHDTVAAAGFDPGLYVGWHCGLSPDQLYGRLKFRRYWAAYNLNRDQYPSVRGVQMQQRPYPGVDARVPGIAFQYDVDIIGRDARDGTPALLLP